jgi:hypothetical protein
MRLLALALTLSLAVFAVASAQTVTPDSENGRYSFNPVADGVLRLDSHTGQVSQCSRSDAGWACKVVPDERSALETEIARLQGENATLKKELLGWDGMVSGLANISVKISLRNERSTTYKSVRNDLLLVYAGLRGRPSNAFAKER